MSTLVGCRLCLLYMQTCKHANFVGVPVRKSQICKFLWLMCKSQIRKFLQNATQLCSKTVLKVAFWKIFYFAQSLVRAFYANSIFVMRLAEVLKQKLTKKIRSANRKSSDFADLRFVELICWPPFLLNSQKSVLSGEVFYHLGKWFFCRMKVTGGAWRTPWIYLFWKNVNVAKLGIGIFAYCSTCSYFMASLLTDQWPNS